MYCRLYCFGVFLSDDPLNNFKPFFILAVLFVFTLMQLYAWYCLIANIKSNISFYVILPIVIIMIIMDYFIFTRKHRWKNEALNFKNFTKKKKIFWDIIVLIIVIIIIGSFIFSMYELNRAGLRGRSQ